MTRKAKPREVGGAPLAFAARKAHSLTATDPEDARRESARYIASAELAAARTISAAEGTQGISDLLDVPELVATLREQAKAVQSGDLAQAEGMLMNQATALQSLFARLTERGMATEYLPQFEAFMRMALRAQSQCRATLETLVANKNPPIIYAKQANIAAGHQQVNNGPASRTQETEIAQNRVLEASHAERMDTRAAEAAGRADPAVATVGAINRAKKRGRQSAGIAQR